MKLITLLTTGLLFCGLHFLTILGLPAACQAATPPPGQQYAKELRLYNWADDIPKSVLDAFTRETRIEIDYQVFNSQEEAVANIRAGKSYDVAVVDGRFIPQLVQDNLLKKLNYEHLLNFKYISPNFRGLAYDPENRYSVPYSWGTTGILINTGEKHPPVTKWADLWDPQYAGKVAVSISYPREALGLTLKSLGFPANSEKPADLDAALAKLLQLKLDPTFLYRAYPEFGPAAMTSGKILIAVGFSGDLLESQKNGQSVEYVLPTEGLLLWADTFVIPANSRSQVTAELFINFLLRPEINAEIVNQKYYASANEAAKPFVLPEILSNRAIYPTDRMLSKAEILEPISPTGQKLYDAVWQKFLEANPESQ